MVKLINDRAAKNKVREGADFIRKNLSKRLLEENTKSLIGFHYNGHDVPRPTDNGEIWLFSEKMDQYHPLLLHELAQSLKKL